MWYRYNQSNTRTFRVTVLKPRFDFKSFWGEKSKSNEIWWDHYWQNGNSFDPQSVSCRQLLRLMICWYKNIFRWQKKPVISCLSSHLEMVGRWPRHQGGGRGHVQLHGVTAAGVGADLGVPRAPAAPDQRAQVLEAEHRPPVEGEVTHADQSHARQVHQVKLNRDKLWSILVKFQGFRDR